MIGYKEIDDGVIIMKILVDNMPETPAECPYSGMRSTFNGVKIYDCILEKCECIDINKCQIFTENKTKENIHESPEDFICYNSCKHRECRPGYGRPEQLIRKSKIVDIIGDKNDTDTKCVKKICELVGVRYPWIKKENINKKFRDEVIDEVSKAIEDKFMSVAPDELYYTYEPYQIVREVREITNKLKDK